MWCIYTKRQWYAKIYNTQSDFRGIWECELETLTSEIKWDYGYIGRNNWISGDKKWLLVDE